MTTSSRNYNIMALRGADVDDLDVVSEYGLDPSVAYTPKINDAAIEAQRLNNISFYQSQGMDEKKATKMANKQAARVKSDVKKLMK